MPAWDTFFKEKCIDILTTCDDVLDIGEGLRAREREGNRFDKSRAWLQPYLKHVNYRVIDPVPDYKPDIVGDIHALPLDDDSTDGIFCLAVLEHVKNPILAISEMRRVLKPGGKLLIYVPFLYYYHAHQGYYKDYWRFTYDCLEEFGQEFSHYEIVESRLPVETIVWLTPLGRLRLSVWLARKMDAILYKKGSRQVSGYYVYLKK